MRCRAAALAAVAVTLATPAAAQDDLRQLVAAQQELLARQAAQIELLERRVRELEMRGPVTGSAVSTSPSQPVAQDASSVVPDGRGPTGSATLAAGSRAPQTIGRFPDDAVVHVGSFDRAIAIPGTGLSVRIGGFAQVDGSYDTAANASLDAFLARAIGASRTDALRFSARNTRLNVDVRGSTDAGPFRAFLEGDFAGSGGNELVSNSTSFRLRHAFGQLGSFYAGQYWSTFVDVTAYPETIDTTSPAGKSVTRQAGMRYVGQLGEGFRFAVAAENPESDLSLPDGGGVRAVERAPDMHGLLRTEQPWGHVQLAGVARFIAASKGDEANRAFGWGLNLTGRVQTPFLAQHDNLVFSLVGGKGVGRYIVELAGAGYDAVHDPITGEMAVVGAIGGYLGYQHWWEEAVRSTFTFGHVEVDVPPYLDGTSLVRATTASANLLWNPVPAVLVGTEVLWGRRGSLGRVNDDALRFQTVARFNF